MGQRFGRRNVEPTMRFFPHFDEGRRNKEALSIRLNRIFQNQILCVGSYWEDALFPNSPAPFSVSHDSKDSAVNWKSNRKLPAVIVLRINATSWVPSRVQIVPSSAPSPDRACSFSSKIRKCRLLRPKAKPDEQIAVLEATQKRSSFCRKILTSMWAAVPLQTGITSKLSWKSASGILMFKCILWFDQLIWN